MIELEKYGLPDKFQELRPQQVAILDKFTSIEGSLLVEAPPGTGKTIVAALLPKLLGVKVAYITPNKSLQYQICEEIPYARMIMGRANYECLYYPGNSALACTNSKATPCPMVTSCPYIIAREEATNSDLAVLNSTYYLYASNYTGQFQRDLLIVDEADQFERVIVDFVKVELSGSNIRRLLDGGYNVPEADYSVEEWVEWAQETIDATVELAAQAKQLKRLEEAEQWGRLTAKLKYMVVNVDDTWFTEVNDTTGSIAFRPVVVRKYASNLVWDNHKRALAMSATILDPEIVAGDLDLDAEYMVVSTDFPIENRPIYNMSKYLGSLNVNNISEKLPTIKVLVERIAEAYPESKVLVHCHSYSLTKMLFEAIGGGDRFIMNSSAKDRQEVFERFLISEEPLVLLSPSFERGIDLAGDDFQCVIVVKAPFANMGSKSVSLRMKMPGGNNWYQREASANLVQMCGRVVRSKTDKGDAYILDEACIRLITRSPEWFQDAVEVYG